MRQQGQPSPPDDGGIGDDDDDDDPHPGGRDRKRGREDLAPVLGDGDGDGDGVDVDVVDLTSGDGDGDGDGVVDLTLGRPSSSSASSASSSPRSGRESESGPPPPPAPAPLPAPRSFAVGTWNAWFQPHRVGRRMEEMAAILLASPLGPGEGGRPSPPVAVGFQEVTPDLARFLFPPLRRAGYRVIEQPGTAVGYGVALAVREGGPGAGDAGRGGGDAPRATLVSSGFEPYGRTKMERGLLWARLRVRLARSAIATEIVVGTTHLESFLGKSDDGSRERRGQVLEAAAFLSSSDMDAAILLGDLNWDDERSRRSRTAGTDEGLLSVLGGAGAKGNGKGKGGGWTDAWLDARPGEEGHTYDSKLNGMLRGSLRRRLDRCLVWTPEAPTATAAAAGRSAGTDAGRDADGGRDAPPPPAPLSVRSCSLIGTEVIPGCTYRKEKQRWTPGGFVGTGEETVVPVSPSDHFGLLVTLG